MVWSFTCCRPESSERLIEFAQALSNVDQNHATFQAYYPMYTLPVDSILHMVYPTAHEQLLADNSLVIFDQSLGQAMFISHEWSGRSHPDPYGEQVRVLQDALHHMLYVADTVPVEFASELIFGQDRGMMTSELKSRELFVWFDFFSCPQLEGSVQGIEDVQQQNAIRSIPAYVEMSRFFVIHCPFVRRDGSDHLLNKHTWARRAWCRLERLASQLHAGLGSDRSLGAIFPDWYAGNTERWLAASSKQLQVLCTETTGFEVPKRISVSLSAYRKAQHVVIFLGDKETWGSPDSPKSAQGEMDMAPRNSLPTGEFKRPRGKLRFSRSLSQQQIPDPIVTPLDFVTEQRYVCTAQVRRDVDRHLNLVIFGAAGDLAKKKTFPSIFQLHLNRVLPSNISVVACDDPGYHSNISNAETLLQNRLKPYLEKECSKPSDLREFAENLQFVPVDFKDAGTVRKLDEHLRSNAKKLQDNRIFYLALPPFLFETAVKFIREECWPENGYTRVIVEKPFGHDLQSAKALGSQVAQYLQESQVYRIDHYLAKNMVLNILALRFANRELGRLFHADNVSIVRITFKEDINVAGRAGYFDGYGIIRDVMQNHLLQLLTLVLMEAPASLDPEDVRDEKVKVLKQFRPVTREDCVVGQYDGYQDDPAIQAINEKQGYKSKCPTFAACVLHLDNERWSNVPIIMKAGKSLERRSTIVRLQFKKAPPNSLFGDQPQNELVIRIQPDEAIYYRILAKTPGLSARAHEVQRTILDLDLRKEEVGRLPDAYEKLIHDVIQGESHNFVRADEVEEGWRIFDPLLQSLESPSAPHPFPYAQGTRGPPEADALINSTGYRRYTATGVQGLAQDFH